MMQEERARRKRKQLLEEKVSLSIPCLFFCSWKVAEPSDDLLLVQLPSTLLALSQRTDETNEQSMNAASTAAAKVWLQGHRIYLSNKMRYSRACMIMADGLQRR